MNVKDCLETVALVSDWVPPGGVTFSAIVEFARLRVLGRLSTCCTDHTIVISGPGTKDVAFRKLDDYARLVIANRDARHMGLPSSEGSDDPDAERREMMHAQFLRSIGLGADGNPVGARRRKKGVT